MMPAYKQQEIDWENSVHRRENTALNEKHLNENRYRFIGQAATVYSWLQKGLKVTSLFAVQNGISHVQRRVGDIGEFGSVDVDREYATGQEGKRAKYLIYFLPENRQLFIDKKWIINRPRWWYSELYTPPEIIEKIKSQNEKQNTNPKAKKVKEND